jgi:hypothetical protein
MSGTVDLGRPDSQNRNAALEAAFLLRVRNCGRSSPAGNSIAIVMSPNEVSLNLETCDDFSIDFAGRVRMSSRRIPQ